MQLTPEQQTIVDELPTMPLYRIAALCQRDWLTQGKIYFGAKPYLEALVCLENITDEYGCDSGRSIVSYFLCNAGTWKGPIARAVKAELNKRLKK